MNSLITLAKFEELEEIERMFQELQEQMVPVEEAEVDPEDQDLKVQLRHQ